MNPDLRSTITAQTQWSFPYNITWGSSGASQCLRLGDLFVVAPEAQLWFVCRHDASTGRTTALANLANRKSALAWARARDASGELEIWRSDREWDGRNREVVYANAQAARDALKT